MAPFRRPELAAVHDQVVAAIANRDPVTFAALYTDDGALLLPTGRVVTGRSAIQEEFASWLAQGFVRQTVELVTLSTDENFSIEEGQAIGEFETPDGRTESKSHYLIVHKRQPDGTWLMHRDIWTTIPDMETPGVSY
uniref:DUF4440 domain-containing protein n=1 Tax=Rhodococcus sp. TMP1 TaxID=1072366 RepID=M1X7K0_9NOCA|nr:hypothetical protein [Rhodococcus sp. TMP1]